MSVSYRRRARDGRSRFFAAAGVLAETESLARADGMLLLLVIPAAVLLTRCMTPAAQELDVLASVNERTLWNREQVISKAVRYSLVAALGYFAIMLPWFARNSLVVGNANPRGGSQDTLADRL